MAATEPEIFVEQLGTGRSQPQWGGDLRTIHRQPIFAEEVWAAELTDVPPENPLPAATSNDGDTAAGGAVVIRKNKPLEPDPAGPAPYRYRAVGPFEIRKVIPATWGVNGQGVTAIAGSYAPELRSATGALVPYDVAVWVLDGTLHALEFNQDADHKGLPPGAVPPFTLTYWEYGGPTAGGGGGSVSGGANVGTGSAVFKQTTLGGTMEFRTLTDGLATVVVQSANELEISSGVVAATQAGHGLTVGEAVYWTGSAWALAKADAVATLATHLVVRVPDANTLWLSNSVVFDTGAPHGFTPGDWLYTSAAVAGMLTPVEPGGPAFSNPIALAYSATELHAFGYRASMSAGGGPSGGTLASHLKGRDAAYAAAGGAGPAAAAAYGAGASPEAAGFASGAPTVARWAAFAPQGYSPGGAVAVRVRYAAAAGGVAFRAGAQSLKPASSVAALAPIYGAPVVSAAAGATTVAATTLALGGTGPLAGGEPFWFYLERATGTAGDTSAGVAAVHDVFLEF